ncbi:acyl-CoA carboxylase epsilon subunit [Streptomyces sp. SL13]|uniref:Acyl-CoA carboxylase epsilon subunit n=1 Tax=Streptantibioticus silvisoli TaxID=2705255 RepID=A0AA90KG46_9ACTN|nr:acyl-CoA carboxylase epsilon subunit [Streptantibioticus silvisoli]MDI5966866.1 acyl-CoA carboxylase epsilon subunit [Streptantibioticus silvisoli]MDI5970125.1 acyl-CoA carboxylase epsilon subunit [Streptantibioticus silvisoli]
MMLKVVRGNPTPEELAAALAVVTARSAVAAADEGEPAPRRWADPARVAAGPLPRFGAGAWRTTYWPR